MKAAILVSRQQLHPCRTSPWVRGVISAVEWCAQNNVTVLASTEMPTWELIASAARLHNINQLLFIPASSPEEFDRKRTAAGAQFDLGEDNMAPCYFKEGLSRKEAGRLRDELIINSADLLIPICVRKNGTMDELLGRKHCSSSKILTQFECLYETRSKPVHYSLDIRDIPEELKQVADTHIIHWTRTSNSAWPGERKIDYYRAILESDTYPRSAFSTLQNILTTGTLFASSKHMPRKTRVVSFSGCEPAHFVPLMKWRSRYRQMSFEPFGIGFERQWALSRGIKSVYYTAANRKPEEGDE
jgi:hypothetical protein